MSSDRWQEVDRLCLAALERDPAARSAFLDEACADDLHLRGEVESLLAAQSIGDAVLAVPAIEAAAKALAAVDDDSVAGASAVGSLSPADGLLSSGTRLGPYELDGLIAAGGMGQVYRALDTRLGREVAVKVLPPEVAADPDRLHRFQLEARAVAALNHPNILAIYDVGVSSPVPGTTSGATDSAAGQPVHYLVTELFQGQTLRERIAKGRLPLTDALAIALQVARALAAAHAKHIVHRDLKPSNVFLTADGPPKLLDFGIAKVVAAAVGERVEHETAFIPMAETGPRMGTVGYSSPEQIKGQPTDARSDIFSFGAVLYEMLTGRRAFSGDTAADTPSAILEEDPTPLADYCDEAPAALRHIVSRSLAKNPDDRFQSADALVGELGVVSRALAAPRQRRRPVLAAVALFALAATLGAAYTVWRQPAANQRHSAKAPTASPEAYRLYLQGNEYWKRPGGLRTNLEVAEQLYEKALHEDPGFALAHAALSIVHGTIYWLRYDPSADRAVRQREQAEEAVRLAPDLSEGHHALGLAHYYGRQDYRAALDELTIAGRNGQSDAELLADIGYVNRRLGRWDEAVAAYQRAIELEPRRADVFYDLGGETFALLHRYADAVTAYGRALTLAPDMYEAEYRRALAYLLWQGRLESLRDVLSHLPEGATLGASGTVAGQRAAWLLLERDAAGLLQMPEVRRATDFEASTFFLPSELYRGWAHQMRGDPASAREAFSAAVTRLDVAVRELPGDWRVHAARGFALAGAGRRDDAAAEARWLKQCAVYRTDAHYGMIAAEFRAQILAQSGSADAALDEIERLLPGPSWLSVHTLRLDPRWDPIRARPRFRALLRKYSS
jgi:tetratricopeptide (TPR) repeat protein